MSHTHVETVASNTRGLDCNWIHFTQILNVGIFASVAQLRVVGELNFLETCRSVFFTGNWGRFLIRHAFVCVFSWFVWCYFGYVTLFISQNSEGGWLGVKNELCCYNAKPFKHLGSHTTKAFSTEHKKKLVRPNWRPLSCAPQCCECVCVIWWVVTIIGVLMTLNGE